MLSNTNLEQNIKTEEKVSNVSKVNFPTQEKKVKSKKNLGILKVVIICVVVSFIVSTIAGFASSGLGNVIVQSLSNRKLTIPDKIITVKEESQTIDVAKKVQPSVVSIVVSKDLQKLYQYDSSPFQNDPFFKDFFQDSGLNEQQQQNQNQQNGQQEIGGGTGFVISSDGVILTNRHVVSDQEASYTVVTNDNKKYDAKIQAIDPTNDVAVLKIDANNLTPVELGNSDALQIGQDVIAIGNAMGEYHNTVTKGVVSGLGRAITAGDQYSQAVESLDNIIQTDAAINPGNSGGPLLNIDGQVVGINTAMDYSGQSIGFAIPINDAKTDIDSVKKDGKISKPFLGVRYQIINKSLATKNNLKYEYGALVLRGTSQDEVAIAPGSPADKAGLVENDIILELNGTKIDSNNTLAKLIAKYKIGDEVTLKISHKGEEKEVKLKLEERKS
ncbi:MAG: trypsin-like peptidase domain-containing protein [Patescibacteria group bacterium]|jgi:S1-C subfamily serine protease